MISYYAKHTAHIMFFIVGVTAFTSTSPPLAQQGTIPSRRTSPITRDMRYREWVLQDLERTGKKKGEEPLRLALLQIKEDFERIQVINNSMVQALILSGALDYKLIAEATSEINKRAMRLHQHLALPESVDDDKRQLSQDDNLQLKTLLSVLDGMILRFVRNPMFKSTGVVNAQLSAKARRDLEGIIELSKKIRKAAEKLRKEQTTSANRQ